MKKYDLAIADLTTGLMARPTSVGFLAARAEFYEQAGELEESITDFEAALAAKPLSEVEPKIRAKLAAVRDKLAKRKS